MAERMSANFTREEFACKGMNCCGHSAPVSVLLVDALQELRNIVGVPLHINSGFRCITHNRRIGSRDTSQHPRGTAADVDVPDGFTVDQFAELAEEVRDFADGAIGLYYTKGFLHLDTRTDGPARWAEGDPLEGNPA